jgi:hypothetical protein
MHLQPRQTRRIYVKRKIIHFNSDFRKKKKKDVYRVMYSVCMYIYILQ